MTAALKARKGHRVVRTTPAAANGHASTPAAATDPAAPEPTIRTMIVCVADDLPGEVFDQRVLARQLRVDGGIVVRFWAKPAGPVRRRQLIDPRQGKAAIDLSSGAPRARCRLNSGTARPHRYRRSPRRTPRTQPTTRPSGSQHAPRP